MTTRAAHQVIYTHGAGRLGNQVMRFVHWMAWVRASGGGVEIMNLSFWPFADYFAIWREHPGCVFPVRNSAADWWARRRAGLPNFMRVASEQSNRLPRVVQAMGRWRPGWQAIDRDIRRDESIDLDDPAFFARVKQRAVTTCSGWRIASWRLVAEQQSELKTFFAPAPEFARPAARFIARLRQKHDLLIGVLIRQSDYREWDDGRFYFPTTQYAEWLRQVIALYPGRNAAVVIASEDRQDEAALAGLPYYFATGTPNAGAHWFENWVELALCDFIVTPPSTFSATAAFLGGIPLWPVVRPGQVMAVEQRIEDGLVGAARHPEFSRSVK